jgi:nitrogen fixation NifU-like protein
MGEEASGAGHATEGRGTASLDEERRKALLEQMGDGVHPVVWDHAWRPRNAGVLADPDGEATLTRACGDGLCVQVRLRGDLVDQIRFMTNGCGAMVACGSAVTQLATGRRLEQALAIDDRRITEFLEGLPMAEAHCAALAARALRAALRDALVNRTESWKRPYRRRDNP